MAVGGAFLTMSAFDAYYIGMVNGLVNMNLQASSKQECIRLRPARLFVIRRGKVIGSMPETLTTVNLGPEITGADFYL